MSELQNKVEIHMEHIGMVYPADGKEVTALTDVTLDIQKGEFVSLVGPSGCGKTTLLRIICRSAAAHVRCDYSRRHISPGGKIKAALWHRVPGRSAL